MIEVVRERRVEAPPDRVWALIDDLGRSHEWFTFAERMELLEGSGLHRRQRLHGRWGRKRSEVDQTVTVYEPHLAVEWRHDEERLEGKPAPEFARETRFRIELAPEGRGTTVRLISRQQPASYLKGLVIRMFGKREVTRHMERSLDRLARAASTERPPDPNPDGHL